MLAKNLFYMCNKSKKKVKMLIMLGMCDKFIFMRDKLYVGRI